MKCNCEQSLKLELRTVKHSRSVTIRHVPVLVCDQCMTYQLIPSMRSDLKRCIDLLGSDPGKTSFSMTDHHELAGVIYDVLADEDCPDDRLHAKFEDEIEGRINLLLDMYRLAEGMRDDQWVSDIRQRLSQLSVILPEMNVFHADV